MIIIGKEKHKYSALLSLLMEEYQYENRMVYIMGL